MIMRVGTGQYFHYPPNFTIFVRINSIDMHTILGIGNALTDILAVLPDDSFLKLYHLPKGSMQFVDMETGNKIF